MRVIKGDTRSLDYGSFGPGCRVLLLFGLGFMF